MHVLVRGYTYGIDTLRYLWEANQTIKVLLKELKNDPFLDKNNETIKELMTNLEKMLRNGERIISEVMKDLNCKNIVELMEKVEKMRKDFFERNSIDYKNLMRASKGEIVIGKKEEIPRSMPVIVIRDVDEDERGIGEFLYQMLDKGYFVIVNEEHGF